MKNADNLAELKENLGANESEGIASADIKSFTSINREQEQLLHDI